VLQTQFTRALLLNTKLLWQKQVQKNVK